MVTMARMAKRFELMALILIVVVAGWLRLYRLGSIPPSLDWDEVSLAYNAQSLLQTGKDEFGHSWPLSIQSFGDYKPPVYTYILIPTLKVFGKTEFAVRLPSALAGILTVLATYFLAKELVELRNKKQEARNNDFLSIIHHPSSIGFIAALLLAISPWHLQFSRIAFEANVGLFFFVTGMWLLIRAFHKSSQWSLFFSVVSMSVALMSYHSLRVAIPLLVLTILWIYKKELLYLTRSGPTAEGPDLYWLPIILSAVLTILTILTISYTVFFQNVGQSRFNETSFLTIDDLLTVSRQRIEQSGKNFLDRSVNHRFLVYAKQFTKGYLDHYSFKFWFLDGDSIDRHRTPGVGLLYWWELPFLVMGLIFVFRRSFDSTQDKKSDIILIFWLLLAPTASALTGGTPSAVRSLVFLPTFQIFTAVGLRETISLIAGLFGRDRFFPSEKIAVTPEPRTRALATHGRRPWEQASVVLGLASIYLFLVSFEVIHYFHQYYIHSSLEYASSWQYGYKQMVEKTMAEKDNYKKILITTSYDQPYIYFLWYGNYDPKFWVNDGEFNKRFDKFEFKKIEKSDTQFPENALIIGVPLEIPGGNLKWRIDYPDGQAAFLAIEHL